MVSMYFLGIVTITVEVPFLTPPGTSQSESSLELGDLFFGPTGPVEPAGNL